MQKPGKTKSNLRSIPSVDRILNTPEINEILDHVPRWLVLMIVREVLDEIRRSVIHMML